MSEWKPIETAPKNETDILLYRMSPVGRPLPPVVAGWFNNGEAAGWSSYDNPDEYLDDEVTHWMPLPAAPKVTK